VDKDSVRINQSILNQLFGLLGIKQAFFISTFLVQVHPRDLSVISEYKNIFIFNIIVALLANAMQKESQV
jgi:hypothetical protein